MELTCPYCGATAVLVTGREVYPHRPDLYGKAFWRCGPCDAWVGCYPGTTNPMGRLADAELRRAKQNAHAAFDPLWRRGVYPSRTAAYQWLASQLGIHPRDCHIGMFDAPRCLEVTRLSLDRLRRCTETR